MHDRLDLAIWLEPEPSSTQRLEEEGIQAHLNFWKLPECKALDIGIDFPFMKAGKVNIFIATDKNVRVENLSPLLKDAEILNTLFNEFVATETCPAKTKCLKATRPAQEGCKASTFCLCCLEECVKCRDAYGGRLIEIDVANAPCTHTCECGRQYVRLRLMGDAITESYRKEKIPCSKFEYYTSRLEFLDFRLNNVRSLPSSLLRSVNTYPKLSKIRCFLMLQSSEKLVLYNKNYRKVRPLEKEKWARYLPLPEKTPSLWPKLNKEEKAILAYQWNSDTEEQSFSLFTGIKSSSISWRTIVFFLLISMFFGILPSLIASFIWEKIRDLL